MEYYVITALHWPKMIVDWRLFKDEDIAEQYAIQELGLKPFQFMIRKITT